jgi:predicted dehydrogenase
MNSKSRTRDRVRIGVVGCGAVAQIQHLPNLAFLRDEFDVTSVCDVSANLARGAAQEYGIATWHTDLAAFLNEPLEAVLLCHTDPKVDAALQVLDSGRHLFIEKPVAFVADDVDRMAAAAHGAHLVAQAGYMKLYDPAFIRVEQEVATMRDSLRFVQINHLHTDNRHHLSHFRLRRADDVPAADSDAFSARRQADAARALGEVPEHVRSAFFHLAGSMIHDLYGLRQLLGPPDCVASTEIWNGGLGITTVLGWTDGPRCSATWVELERIRHFQETLEIYSADKGVILSYPTGFSRGQLSCVTVRGIDSAGESFEQHPAVDWESPFVAQLRHFHSCVTQGEACRTPLAEARHDVQLVVDITRAGLPT